MCDRCDSTPEGARLHGELTRAQAALGQLRARDARQQGDVPDLATLTTPAPQDTQDAQRAVTEAQAAYAQYHQAQTRRDVLADRQVFRERGGHGDM